MNAVRSAASGRPLSSQRRQAVSASTSIQITRCSLQRTTDRVGAERAAAERHEPRAVGRPAVEQLERHPLLDRPERGLPVGGEDLRDRLAGAALDLGVGVDRDPARRLRERLRRGRLAGAHEADDRHRPVDQAGDHPIRSL